MSTTRELFMEIVEPLEGLEIPMEKAQLQEIFDSIILNGTDIGPISSAEAVCFTEAILNKLPETFLICDVAKILVETLEEFDNSGWRHH
jgi:hypothetical protein